MCIRDRASATVKAPNSSGPPCWLSSSCHIATSRATSARTVGWSRQIKAPASGSRASMFIGQWLRRPVKPACISAQRLRARARSLCAEMHAGFTGLRSHCPMNIEARLPEAGALIWRDQPTVRADVARLVAMWQELLNQHGGPLLFGAFTVADAYFAPICTRLKTYALPLPEAIAGYVGRVCALPGVKAWIDGALAEQDFLDFEEPYRLKR